MGENSKDAAPKKSFFKGVKTEFNKIVWPSRKDVVKETAVVTVVSIIVGLIIVVVDIIIKYGVDILVNL